jgi:RNA binding exosome subunit
MILETDAIFAKLHADLHPGLLSRLVTFNWARQAEQAVFEALGISAYTTTTHARVLVAHGESVHNDLRFLESIAVDISSLLVSEGAAVQREKEDIEARVLTIFGGYRDAIRILKGRVTELRSISHFWMEARVSLSQGIHAFNGMRSDLTALSEHQSGPKTARLHLPADKQSLNLKEWARRLDARRVLMPQVGILLLSHSMLSNRVLFFRYLVIRLLRCLITII